MKWNLHRELPWCLSKQNVWTLKLRKVNCFKRLWPERNDCTWLHLFIKDEICPSWQIIRPTRRYVTSWGAKQSAVTWISSWLRAWAVLFSLLMGCEAVYLCCDFSEVLPSWWDGNANESRMGYPSTDQLGPRRSIQDVSLQISVGNFLLLKGYTISPQIIWLLWFLIHFNDGFITYELNCITTNWKDSEIFFFSKVIYWVLFSTA